MSQAASVASPQRAGVGISTTGASEPGQRCTIRCWCPGPCTGPAIHIWPRGTGNQRHRHRSLPECHAAVGVRKDFPLRTQLLAPTHWMVHAYHEDLNQAMRRAALECSLADDPPGLWAEDAYALMSVAADFTVTQVVDQRRGVHAALAKSVFVGR